MRARIDFSSEDLFGTGNRDRRYLAAQLIACSVYLEIDLGARAFELPLFLRLAFPPTHVDNLVRARLRLVHDAAGLIARLVNDFLDLNLRL
jgi:hypothetical protein